MNTRNVAVPAVFDDDGKPIPLTRKQRRLAGIKLVGVRYTKPRVGRNQLVSIDDRPPVKFKRTGQYRERRV